jgi:hypothetical protein
MPTPTEVDSNAARPPRRTCVESTRNLDYRRVDIGRQFPDGTAMKKATLVAIFAALLVFAPSASAAGPRLEGWWSFNELRNSQVAWDWSGQGNHGQLGSTPGVDANDPTRIAGWFLGGLRFGGDDFVRIPASTDLEPSKVTVAAWVRGSSSPGQWQYILSKGSSACDAGSYGLYSGRGGGLAFYISDGTTWVVSPEKGPEVWDGRWHFVAGTFDGSTVRAYVDGAQIGTGTPSSMQIGYGLSDGSDGYIGAYRGSCDMMITADLDEVLVWNQALPISDIWNRFGAVLGGR